MLERSREYESWATDATTGSALEQYLMAIGYREIACFRCLPELPESPVTLCGPGTYQPSREKEAEDVAMLPCNGQEPHSD